MIIINEHTEFSLDMIRGLPRAYYYSINGIDHICKVKQNLKELYQLVSNNVEESAIFSTWNPDDMFNHERPEWTKYEWQPPPLKDMFKGYLKFDKPTVVINNKCSSEWNVITATDVANKFNLDISLDQIIPLPGSVDNASINHYSIPMLDKLVTLLSEKYQVIYIRPITTAKYFSDDNILIPFDDFEFLEKNHPYVYTIKQFLNETNLTDNYTIAQFMLESTSDKHLSVIGANAKIAAYFGGEVIMYKWEGYRLGHRKGNRGIFQTDSWLKHLGGSKMISMDNYNSILQYISDNWL